MRALVLSSGGSAIPFHVGALEGLYRSGIQSYDVVVGSSAGAIVAAQVVQANGTLQRALYALREVFHTLESKDVWRKRWAGYLAGLWEPSFYSTAPLAALLDEHVKPEEIVTSRAHLRFALTNLTTGEVEIATNESPFLKERLRASAAFPPFFEPVHIGSAWYTDGAVRQAAPIGAALQAGATEVDVVMLSPEALAPWDESAPNALDVSKRALGILVDAVSDADIQQARRINHMLLDNECASERYRYVPIRVFRPEADLVTRSWEFDPAAYGRLREAGLRAVVEGIDE